MSLATRCTACGTIFRVVQDQLRVSDGWVRCGRCAEVFDAREQLFDIDREPPPPWPAPVVEPEPEPAPPAPQADPEPWPEPPATLARAPAENPQRAPAREEPPAEPPAHAHAQDEMPEHAIATEPPMPSDPAPPPPPEPQPADLRLEPSIDAPVAPDPATQGAAPPASRRLSEWAADPADAPAPAALPEFVRRAQQQERWQRPGIRIALALACLLALLLLGFQLTWQYRDAIASLRPETAPALRAQCASLGCELRPWRRIEAISVEQSALNQAGAGNNYKLSLTLRNKSAHTLALPWVDLSLTDASGQQVARRMLSPTDFGLRTDALAGGAEQPLQLVFSTGNQRVTGYTVEIFHP